MSRQLNPNPLRTQYRLSCANKATSMHVCKAKNVRVFYVLFLSSVCTRVLVSLSPCACECALSLLHMYAHAHTQMQRARTAHALTHGERLRNERTPGEGVRPLCLVSVDPGGRPRPDMMQLQWSLPRWVQVQCRYLRSCTQNVAACKCTNSFHFTVHRAHAYVPADQHISQHKKHVSGYSNLRGRQRTDSP